MESEIAIVGAASLAASIYFAIMLRRARWEIDRLRARHKTALEDQEKLRDANREVRDDNDSLRDDNDRLRDDLKRTEDAGEALAAQLDETNRLMGEMDKAMWGVPGQVLARHAKERRSIDAPHHIKANGHEDTGNIYPLHP